MRYLVFKWIGLEEHVPVVGQHDLGGFRIAQGPGLIYKVSQHGDGDIREACERAADVV